MYSYRIDQYQVHLLVKPASESLGTISVSSLHDNLVLQNTGSNVLVSSLHDNLVLQNTGSNVLVSSLVVNAVIKI